MADEIEDVLGLPPEDDPEPGQEAAETEQHGAVLEAENAPQGDATLDEGSDTGETAPESPEPAEQTDVQKLLAKMEALERANSGLYSEVRSERDRRKQLMDEIQKRSESEQAAKKKADAEASIPDKDEDPAGYLAAQQRQLVESVEQRLERMEQVHQQEMQHQVYRQAEHEVAVDEARFAEQNPHYYDALNFARQERSRLLRATHPDQPDEWVQGMIQQGDRMFALQSLQQGVSPAARAMDYATRLGFKPDANGTTQQGSVGTGGAHNPAPAGSTPAPATKPKQTSLSGVQGKGGGRGRKLTMDEAVNQLSDADFDAVFGDPVKSAELSEQGYTHW